MAWGGTSSWGGAASWGAGTSVPPPPPPLPDEVGPCVLSADNPKDGILVVRFNETMLQDNNIGRVANYEIFLRSGAQPLTVTSVIINPTQTDAATLTFEGGFGDYDLVVKNVFDVKGNEIDPACNTAVFTILKPGGEIEPRVHLFDTVFGVIGMTQKSTLRRTVEQLTVNRIIDHAMQEQLTQRLQSTNAALPTRSGKDGGRRR